MYADIWGAKWTIANALIKYNTVNHDWCTLAEWLVELAKAEIYSEVLVNECIWGLWSFFDDNSKAVQCVWREYSIQDPIYSITMSDYKNSGNFLPDTCSNN